MSHAALIRFLRCLQIVVNDVLNAYGTLTTNILNKSLGYFTQVHNYYLIGMILVVALGVFYFFICTLPYVTRVARESRQVGGDGSYTRNALLERTSVDVTGSPASCSHYTLVSSYKVCALCGGWVGG